MQRVLRFASHYGYAAASSLYLFSLGTFSSRNRSLIRQISTHFGLAEGPSPLIPRRRPRDFEWGANEVRILEPEMEDGNVSLLELVVMSQLVRGRAPRTIFEIGTFDGRTTLNLAANSGDSTRLYTLDLPRDAIGNTALGVVPGEEVYIDKEDSGRRFRGTPYEARIEQLYGDSAKFDFSPFASRIDLVFVDASHAYEYVVNDSQRALEMLSPGQGVILWHDYGIWDGVTRALNELYLRGGEFRNMWWVEGTSLVLLDRQENGGR